MNIDRYRDDARTILSIAGLVLAGGMIFGGAVFTYHLWDKTSLRASYTEELENVRREKGAEISKLEARNDKLTSIIEERLPLIVETQADLTEKLDKTTDQVGKAAKYANRAANQAGKAVKKAREPGGGIRIVPNKPKKPNCFMGKTVYGDPC